MTHSGILYPLRVIHGQLHEWRINVLPLYIERFKNPKAVYLVFTPEHGNLGDHAIAQAEKHLLNELGVQYIEYTGKQLHKMQRDKCLSIMNGRSILIHGGGFLGTLWFDEELLLRDIVSANPRSNIRALPNTIYYENNETGKEELIKSMGVYNNHKRLRFYARERRSYDLMHKIYKDVAINPDMVLYMNHCKSGQKRAGCILCLRGDLEKTRTEEADLAVRKFANNTFNTNIRELDMVKNYSITIEQRDQELEKQYGAFRSSELVITDRLHGMIFSAITGTPCIVINSKSPKVKGCYEWIKDLPYIRFCDDPAKLKEIYESIPKKEWVYDEQKLRPLYDFLKEDIKSLV